MKLEKFTFNRNSPIIEKLIYFIVGITFVAPLMASIIRFFCFTFLGIETNEILKYILLGVCEFSVLMSFLFIYD